MYLYLSLTGKKETTKNIPQYLRKREKECASGESKHILVKNKV